MRRHGSRIASDLAESAAGGGGSAGKRTRSERLPGMPEWSPGAAAAAQEGQGGGAAVEDDPMWFADGPQAGEQDGGDAGGSGNMDPATMAAIYYGINPRRHAEKAYQSCDSSPPLHPRPTTVGRSGTIVALATTLYNRPPFGRKARFSICDRGGAVIYSGEVATPGKVEVTGLQPNSQVLIKPETIGTMVKLLTPEQIAGAADTDDRKG